MTPGLFDKYHEKFLANFFLIWQKHFEKLGHKFLVTQIENPALYLNREFSYVTATKIIMEKHQKCRSLSILNEGHFF